MPGDTLTTKWPKPVVAIITIVVFVLLDQTDGMLFRAFAGDSEGWGRIGLFTVLRYGPWLLVPALLAAVLVGPKQITAALGLNGSLITGLSVAGLVTLPMLITFLAVADFSPGDAWARSAVTGAALPGFFEEVFYRAFLFGFLFRLCGIGFLPAALLGALFFGAAHIYQGGDAASSAAVFAITGLGGAWFAWLFVEWRYNLWVPIFVHTLMNLYWDVFSIADTADGPPFADIARVVVIILSIVFTILVAKRRDGLVVTGRRWLGRAKPGVGEG